MSMNKVIIIFAIILLVFAGFIAYQFAKATFTPKATLPTTEVTIKDHAFTVEVATTSAEKQLGLSGRKKLDADKGMLFVFETSDYHNFWMKNMNFPLDIIFIQDDTIVSIIENAEPPAPEIQEPPILQPTAASNRVLEIQAGLVKQYDIKVGDTAAIKL